MALRDDLLKPIAGPNPCGANFRYEPVYDQIKEARREEDEVPQGEWERARKVADFPKVVKLAGEVLATKSKDLQIAAWLTEALLRTEGFGGLNHGLELLTALLEQFWDHLYPEVDDGDASFRAAPLQWVGDYLVVGVRSVPLTKGGHSFIQYTDARSVPPEAEVEGNEAKQQARQAAVADGKLTPEEFDKAFSSTPKPFYKQLAADLAACFASLQALEALGDAKLADDAPSYTNLRRALEEVQHLANQLLAKKLELEPDPPSATPVAVPGAAGAAPGAGGAVPVEPTSADDAANRVAAAARYLQRADPRNPASYLLLRGFRWGELRAAGPELDPRLLAAPPTAVRTQLKTLLLDARWDELLAAAEGVMASPYGRGWLDLQRYVLTACAQLGAEYEHVTAAIRGALAMLLRDLPQITELTLMDDTPTANVETRAWLQAQGLSEMAAELGTAPAPAATTPSRRASVAIGTPGDRLFERALKEAREGRPQKGIELLTRQVQEEKNPRARFLRRSQIATLMVDAGLETVALPILKELLAQIEAHKLDEWEAGDIAARPMGLLYRCLAKLDGDPTERDELYRRVCRLDPMLAMAVVGDPAPGTTTFEEASGGTDDQAVGS
ncbi:MAG: type VI secretion system protein TssA [Gemmatimonadota bacterium]|nr:type VI secretion system protein TssA [Gemmatimonadota bacterium]